MSITRVTCSISVVAVVGLVGAVTASATAPLFMGLGDFPGGGFSSSAAAISHDGTTVVGSGLTAAGWQPFCWTLADGLVPVGPASDPLYSSSTAVARAVSADGSVIAGDALIGGVRRAWRWNAGGGLQLLNDFAGEASRHTYAMDCTADGGTIFGYGERYPEPTLDHGVPLQWRATPVPTPTPGDWSPMGALVGACSNDGSVLTGRSGYGGPYRWRATTGVEQLPVGDYDLLFSNAADVSGDGNIVVGTVVYCEASGCESRIALWDADGELLTLPPSSDGLPTDGALAVSDDGSVIVGCSAPDPGPDYAILWDALNGTRRLQDVLEHELGLNLVGWSLERACDVAADNETIVGYGINPAGQREAFIARLPEPGTVVGLVVLVGLLRRR